jgi:hypothetical protein
VRHNADLRYNRWNSTWLNQHNFIAQSEETSAWGETRRGQPQKPSSTLCRVMQDIIDSVRDRFGVFHWRAMSDVGQ